MEGSQKRMDTFNKSFGRLNDCPTYLKCNLRYVYISTWTLFFCKSVFKNEFYLRFVSFSIKVNHHVEYGIRHISSSMRSNKACESIHHDLIRSVAQASLVVIFDICS